MILFVPKVIAGVKSQHVCEVNGTHISVVLSKKRGIFLIVVHIVSNYESQRLSIQVVELELRCKTH